MKILTVLAILRPRHVAAAALLLALCGAISALLVAPKLTASLADYDDPGSEFAASVADYTARTGIDPEQGLQILVQCAPAGEHLCPEVSAARTALQGSAHVVRVLDFETTHDPRMLSTDRTRGYLLVALDAASGADSGLLDAVRAKLGEQPALRDRVLVGGPTVANHDTATISTQDLFIAEMVAFPLLALALFFVFRGAVAAALPLVGAGFSIATTFLALFAFQQALQLSTFALNLMTALGTGLAIDFSLLIVSRYREERAGANTAAAIVAAMNSAGRTVLFSGLTVMSALATLCVFPQRFLYSMGLAGIALTAACLLFSLLVLPAVLMLLGDRIDALGGRREKPTEHRWLRWSGYVGRRPARIATLGLMLLLLLAAPALGARLQGYDTDVLPTNSDAYQVTSALRSDFDHADAALTVMLASTESAERAAQLLATQSGIVRVDPPTSLPDGSSLLEASIDASPTAPRAREILTGVRAAFPDAVIFGEVARFDSLLRSLSTRLPYVALLLILVSGLFLGMLTRSVVIPIKNAIIAALTLCATLGVLVLVFQHTPMGGLQSLEVSSLVIVGVLAYGLSTDYASFLFHRMTEARQRGATPKEAVTQGLSRTGPLVTAAALLLLIPLGALVTSRLAPVQMLGFGAAFAILLDATLVRVLLVPSLMNLLGSYNWWPSALASAGPAPEAMTIARR
ncbi:MMPL family transporter [Nocardia yamanashiensis]|uniref:MMPL family transporter n=1 Tax=Nocardia yamanashiensis TaxID=209247 RepID=UPI000835ADFB|nr:MMPL family transporter [Nocardia yamanashiensis]